MHRRILTGVLEGNNVVGGTHATYEPLLNTMFFGFDLKGMPVITMLATRSINYDTHTHRARLYQKAKSPVQREVYVYTHNLEMNVSCALHFRALNNHVKMSSLA